MFTEAKEAIKASSQESAIYIGTDSIRFRKKGKWFARYATVVVLHRDRAKGCQISNHKVTLPDGNDAGKDENIGARMARLLKEVELTILHAQDVLPVCGDRYVEIHLDVNPDPLHGSNIACNSSVGWVTGTLGIEPKVKNQAWAATHAADHVCRQ